MLGIFALLFLIKYLPTYIPLPTYHLKEVLQGHSRAMTGFTGPF